MFAHRRGKEGGRGGRVSGGGNWVSDSIQLEEGAKSFSISTPRHVAIPLREQASCFSIATIQIDPFSITTSQIVRVAITTLQTGALSIATVLHSLSDTDLVTKVIRYT